MTLSTLPDDPRTLALAVIDQALRDISADVSPRAARLSQSQTKPHEVQEAEHFLTDQAGEWASARRDWCDLAGLDESALRQKALAQVRRSAKVPSTATGKLRALEVGQSVLLPYRTPWVFGTMRAKVQRTCGYEFTTQVENGQTRVWRIK